MFTAMQRPEIEVKVMVNREGRMSKTKVLDRLAQDKPLFHHLDDDGAQRVALAGISASPGDTSWAVGSEFLRWIGDHVSGEMITAETGAGNTTVLFAAL